MTFDYQRAAYKLSALMGRKYDVNIIFGGHPSTNGNDITLPHWDLKNPAMRVALYGVIAHEAGGHVSQTCFATFQRHIANLPKEYSREEAITAFNILEDIRIEANLLRRFPGVSPYLNAMVEIYFDSENTDASEHTSFMELALSWCLVKYRATLLNQPSVAPIAKEYDQVFNLVCNPQTRDRLLEIGHRVFNCRAEKHLTSSVLSNSLELLDILHKASSDYHAMQDAQASSSTGNGSDGGKGDQQDAQASSSSGNGADGSKGDQQTAQPSSSTGNGSDGSKGDQQDAQASSSTGNGADGGKGDQQDAQASSSSGNGAGADKQSRLPALTDNLQRAFGDVCSSVIKSVHKEGHHAEMSLVGHSVVNTDPSQAISCNGLLQQARTHTARLNAALSPMLSGDIEILDTQKSGRSLDSRRLTRLKTEADPRIFKKSLIEDDQSIAVQILVDTSLSTQGIVYQQELVSAFGLAQALEQFPDVDVSISHFPTSQTGSEKNRTRVGRAAVIKPFDRSVVVSLKRGFPPAQGGTPLGEAYLSARQNFWASDKERKILLVLTDGKPDNEYEAVKAKADLRLAGVEVYGIVVADSRCSVRGKTPAYPLHLFDESVTITDSKQLPAEMRELVARVI